MLFAPRFCRCGLRTQRGFTLVELMIGLLLGLLVTLVATHVMFNSEGAKRTTTSGSDAQISGAMALAHLERELKHSGYGFAAQANSLGCPLKAKYNGGDIPGFPAVLAPVHIEPGAGGAPDTIRVLSSGKASYSVPIRIAPPGYDPFNPATSTEFTVSNVRGVEGPRMNGGVQVAPGDLMIAVRGANLDCEAFQVTSDPAAFPPKVARQTQDSRWNPEGFPAESYLDGAVLLNMGQMIDRRFQVESESLKLTELKIGASNSQPVYVGPTELYPRIVSIKALFGKDTNGDLVIDEWSNVNPANNEEWRRVIAIRIAVLARSEQVEKEQVTFEHPLWVVGSAVSVPGSESCGPNRCLRINLDLVPSWETHRFKLFDTVIPLRNALWNPT